MSKISKLFKKEQKIVPMSEILKETRNKLGSDHKATKNLEKIVDNFNAGKETLHIAIEPNKKFKIEKEKFYQEEYTIENSRTETFLEIIESLNFKAKKEQQHILDSFLDEIKSPLILNKIEKEGYVLVGDPPMLEVNIEPPKAIIELYMYDDFIDLTK